MEELGVDQVKRLFRVEPPGQRQDRADNCPGIEPRPDFRQQAELRPQDLDAAAQLLLRQLT